MTQKEAAQYIDGMRLQSGGLKKLDQTPSHTYGVLWTLDMEKIDLSGQFAVDELRAIADYVEKKQREYA